MNQTLFSEFPTITSKDWKELILKDLKGAPFEKVKWVTEEGFELDPFYTSEDLGELPSLVKSSIGWKITETILSEKDLLSIETSGADALLFVSHKEGNKEFGIPIANGEALQKLAAAYPNYSLIFSIANRSPEIADSLHKIAISHNSVLVDYDPYGTALLCGELGCKETEIADNFKKLLSGKKFPALGIHSYYLRDSGASIGQELTYSLSWGVDYLNRLLDLGFSLKEANDSIWFWMGVGSDYFFEIAKLRAMRILWAEILNAYEPGFGSQNPTLIFSRTLEFNYSAYDPHVNLLRGTTEAMSAILGGSDYVSVLPFDYVYSEKQELGKRIARNSQLLLRNESFFDKVEDPAAGSYYLETLTQKLITSVWGKFQNLEKEGGFFNALKSGKIQSEVEARATKKREALATKKEILLGTNQYPLPSERHPELETSLLATKHLLEYQEKSTFQRLNPLRLSYDFDRLRFLTDKHQSLGKKVPKVFLLTIGDLTMRKARASFSSNFIGCLGYEMKDNLGFESVSQGILAAKDFGADIVVLCSSDEEYATHLPAFSEEMKKHLPNAWKLLAGYPKDLIQTAESLGIDDFIHMKRNILEFMEKAQSKWIGK